ncbi:hypothetical protein ES703_96815 [subsurface metagenome]
MSYFSSRDLSAILLFSSMWAILSWILAPIVWNLTHLPILCDVVGTTLLILTAWLTKKPGAPFFMGLVTTILHLILRPGSFHFLGFTAASALFDSVTTLVAYKERLSGKWVDRTILIGTSIISCLAAGAIIGSLFMNIGGLYFFVALHGFGGLLGGILGVSIIKALEVRGIPRYRVAESDV